MRIENKYHQESNFNFLVGPQLKAEFQAATETYHASAAEVLRDFMRKYIAWKKKKDAMLKQSSMISTTAHKPNTDEARVMQELEDDLQYFLEEWK